MEINECIFCSLGDVDGTTAGVVATEGESVSFDADGVVSVPSSFGVSWTDVGSCVTIGAAGVCADVDIATGFDSGASPFFSSSSASVVVVIGSGSGWGCGFGGPGAFGSRNRAGTPLAASEPLPSQAPTRRLHL